MRAVVQRVSQAQVDVQNGTVARIGPGLLALIGLEASDTEQDLTWLADKLVNLRIFEDHQGKMNLSLLDTKGELLLVPNFTLAGEARKGRRPSFDNAMRPEHAEPMFNTLAQRLATQVPTRPGLFRATMRVTLTNDGPITILLDSKQ